MFGGHSGVYSNTWSTQLILQFADTPRIKRALSHYVPVNDDLDNIDSDSNAPDSGSDMENDIADSDSHSSIQADIHSNSNIDSDSDFDAMN